ncbi:Kelch repeat-containing protein [Microbulbifer sp. ZKSA004]|uniref:Kelch repeat-containing protein n=1 Tax=Microbulbifer sp. ZKSA004 TaxID=3243389 RepID=UPI004039F404
MTLSRRSFIKYSSLASLTFGGVNLTAKEAISSLSISSLPSLEMPLQEIYPAVFSGEIYVAGGFIPSDTAVFFGLSPTKQTHIFSPREQNWRPGPNLPESRHHLGMASNSNSLYGIGGFFGDSDSAWQARNTVYKLSSEYKHWIETSPLPRPLAESIYTNIGENIHVIGGRAPDEQSKNRDTNSHYVLTRGDHWEQAAPASIKRTSAGGANLNNRIYVVGGRQVSDNSSKARNLTYAEVYDPSLDKWEKIRPLPQAAAGLTATPLNNKLIVAGGEAFGPNGNWKTGTAFNNIWIYDPVTDDWNNQGHLPQARHGHGAVVIGNTLYILGGAKKVGPQETLASLVQVRLKD